MKKLRLFCSKKETLTPMQRLNMRGLGIDSTSETTEKDVLKVLRKKKFHNFGVTAKG